MIKEFHEGEWIEEIYYEIVFGDECGDFAAFPCDEFGKVKNLNSIAQKNYEWCMQHPEKFPRFNKVIERLSSWRKHNWGICECGERVELIDNYMGANDCPNCGRWYNTFGQELNPPEKWEEGDDW